MPKGIINQSNELRKLIFQQSERYNIPLLHLCRYIRIDYDRFVGEYANIKDLSSKSPGISDSQLIELAKVLGLDVRMIIVIKDEKAYSETVPELKKKLYDEFGKKKGSSSQAESTDTGTDIPIG